MAELTKTKLIEILDAANEVITALADENPDLCKENNDGMIRAWDWLNDVAAPPEVIREMARQLLAGIEQEPVAIVPVMYKGIELLKKDGLELIRDGVNEATELESMCMAKALLSAQSAPQLPQPAMVQEVTADECPAYIKYDVTDVAEAWARGYNQCRAAMLQGAEPVQEWIPCSERMPEEVGRYWCYVEEQNSLGKSHYQWNCSWNGDRWWVESENGGRVTHWMPLQEPPKQTSES